MNLQQTVIASFKFRQVEQLLSNLGKFKQLYTNLGNIQALHWNLDTIRNIRVNSKSFNRMWVIETVSFKLRYYWKDLGKVEEVHSDLHML